MLELVLPDPAPPVRATIADTVYEELRRAILELRLEPGSKISEAEMAKRLGVSRQPVREAFGRLARAGYLRIQPQRATEIVKISTREVMNARFIREALEVATVRKACAEAGDEMLARLDGLLAEQADAQADDDRQLFHRLDDAFHQVIAEAADCAFAWTLIDEQKAQMDRVRFLSLEFGQQVVLEEHREIVDALRRRDADAAEAAMRGHLSKIGGIIAQLRSEFDTYFEDRQP